MSHTENVVMSSHAEVRALELYMSAHGAMHAIDVSKGGLKCQLQYNITVSLLWKPCNSPA